jgi:DNA-binding transcriptional ArsR family regulator
VNVKPSKKDNIEVSSDQLKAELVEIKERLGALETIASISNMAVVEAYVRDHLRTEKGKQIMRECAEPRTREELVLRLGFASAQALDHHLKPLREDDLLRKYLDDHGTLTFEWSNLFKRLTKKVRNAILDLPS